VKSISFSLPRRKETKKKTALKRRAGRRRGEALELALPKRSKLALIQRSVPDVGILPLTGTTSADHMRQDLEVFDFQLDPEEVEPIENLIDA
jgi:aryl-alcohol dehydrogenase-like predicted oxidoreductase